MLGRIAPARLIFKAPERFAMEIEKPIFNILTYNRILDELVTHPDSRVRVAAADFIAAFEQPINAYESIDASQT
jgi:hypothetical protein